MPHRNAIVTAIAAIFALLTATAFAGVAGSVEGRAPGLGYLVLAAAAILGVSLVVVPDALDRRRGG